MLLVLFRLLLIALLTFDVVGYKQAGIEDRTNYFMMT